MQKLWEKKKDKYQINTWNNDNTVTYSIFLKICKYKMWINIRGLGTEKERDRKPHLGYKIEARQIHNFFIYKYTQEG